MFGGIYEKKRVLVTGHTGFKGSWLVLWLRKLGAEIAGYALPPATNPSHFNLLSPDILSSLNDLRNYEALTSCIDAFQPEIVFHLAAQPLVRESYLSPRETFEVNVQGTVNVLEACRNCKSVRAVVVITSDKCYENREREEGYSEADRMGGYDPYSASKGCAELVCSAYSRSFFNPADFGKKHNTLLSSCRAGNVVGGGDWAEDRLIPDIMRAAVAGEPVKLRNPAFTRPWQHVLEPLSGYLALGQKLLEGKIEFSGAWNFGPADDAAISVREVTELIKEYWPAIRYKYCDKEHPHEARLLKLDCSKAALQLQWHGIWNCVETIRYTVGWYRNYLENGIIDSDKDLDKYLSDAAEKGLEWTK
jgi:CDP-glucose 4,6-dehydratase